MLHLTSYPKITDVFLSLVLEDFGIFSKICDEDDFDDDDDVVESVLVDTADDFERVSFDLLPLSAFSNKLFKSVIR